MNVFPAFNKSYQQRKRTYKCCRTCRSKRIKCLIKSSNYEANGCENCQQRGLVCDLISTKPLPMVPNAYTSTNSHHAPNSRANSSLSTSSVSPNIPSEGNAPTNSSVSSGPESLPQPIPQSQPAYSLNLQNANNTSQPPFHSTEPVVNEPRKLQEAIQHHDLDSQERQGSVVPQNSSSQPPPQLSAQPSPTVTMYDNRYTIPIAQPMNQMNQMNPTPMNQYNNMTMNNMTPAVVPLPMAMGLINSQPLLPSTTYPSVPPLPSIVPTTSSDDMKQPMVKKRKIDITPEYLNSTFGFNISRTKPRFNKIMPYNDVNEVSSITVGINNRRLPRIRLTSTFEYLKSIDAFTLSGPSPFEINKFEEQRLLKLYFFKINSILPIIHEESFWENYHKELISSILVYSMILAIIRDEASGINIEFLYYLELKIRQLLMILPELGDSDKLVKIQVYTLLSLNFGDHQESNEQSSTDLVSAISTCFSVLIHWQATHDKLIEQGQVDKSIALKKLWFVLLILDRFNGVINAKAFFIKRQDFDITVEDFDDQNFCTLVHQVYKLEDLVVLMYQPSLRGISQMLDYTDYAIDELNKFPQPSFGEDDNLDNGNQAHDKELSKYKNIISYAFNTMIMKLMLMMIFSTNLRSEGKQYEINEQILGLCFDIASLFEFLTKDNGSKGQFIMQIPVIPSLFCLFMSLSIKYKIKSIYITKLGKLNERNDLKHQINKINHTFEKFKAYINVFSSWQFVNESFDNFNYFINKIDKTIKVQMKLNVQDKPNERQILLDKQEQEKENRKRNMRIESLITDVEPVLSISSSSYYSVENLENSFYDGKPTQQVTDTKSSHNQPANGSHNEPLTSSTSDSGTSGSIEANNYDTPNTSNYLPNSSSEPHANGDQFIDNGRIMDEFEQNITQLINNENNQLLMINDGFIDNLNEFVTQDPTLKDFF